MYLVKTPRFIKALFPNFIWNVPTNEKEIFITFDDGPIPEVTPWVINKLAEYNAKATFFCVGENIAKHPDVFDLVKKAGHSVGNHTYNHLSGWNTENVPYFLNTKKCAQFAQTELFRPPYGRMKPAQIQFISRHYSVVMWDVLSGDFDQALSPATCAHNVIQRANKGSIVVFHDSLKAQRNMKYALQKTLDHFSALGYKFSALNEQAMSEGSIIQNEAIQVPELVAV